MSNLGNAANQLIPDVKKEIVDAPSGKNSVGANESVRPSVYKINVMRVGLEIMINIDSFVIH